MFLEKGGNRQGYNNAKKLNFAVNQFLIKSLEINAMLQLITKHKLFLTALVLGLSLFVTSASYASPLYAAPLAPEQVPTLAITADIVQTNLFSGANIMLVALAGIFMLIIGMGFGGKILKAIGEFIMRFAF